MTSTSPINNKSITIVTSYFTMKSKFPQCEYKKWINNFLKLNENMVIFTDLENYAFIHQQRNASNTYIIVTSIEDFHVHQYLSYWQYCRLIDKEKQILSKELYMIWNEKPYFVQRAMTSNPFNSEYFFWMDIGCIRDSNMLMHIQKFSYENIPHDRLILSRVSNITLNPKLNNKGISLDLQNCEGKSCDVINYIQGGYFGGHVDALLLWVELFTQELELFIKTNTFGGKDQYIFNNISLKYPEYIICLPPKEYPLFNTWFSFLIRMKNISDEIKNM